MFHLSNSLPEVILWHICKRKLPSEWLDAYADQYNITRNITYADQICREHGHHILLIPPYHPELQPIEKLWRNVKMYVVRLFVGSRSLNELWDHVRLGFLTSIVHMQLTVHIISKGFPSMVHPFSVKRMFIDDARKFEILYNTPGAHALSLRIDGGDEEEEANSDIAEHYTSCSGSNSDDDD